MPSSPSRQPIPRSAASESSSSWSAPSFDPELGVPAEVVDSDPGAGPQWVLVVGRCVEGSGIPVDVASDPFDDGVIGAAATV